MDHNELANLLEKVANYVDANEAAKTATVVKDRTKLVDNLCVKFAETTGDEVSTELRQKLATSDASVIGILEKLAISASPESLGAPSNRPGKQHEPRTIKEAAAQADERFANWCLG